MEWMLQVVDEIDDAIGALRLCSLGVAAESGKVAAASLGIGATVVNGCVPPPDGMAAVPVAGLPAVRYWAVWRPQREEHARGFLSWLDAEAGA